MAARKRAIKKTEEAPSGAAARQPKDRRSGVDRRVFPRPEGRRVTGGRRKGDGTEA
ncbi:MAG: hypothetical protein IPG50_10505 [Myxococcales bacterium]|mgnify:CR=1 FL=1|nr:hypothetical protein [Myxococcales bacterium]